MNDLPRQMAWLMQQAGMVFALPTGAIILLGAHFPLDVIGGAAFGVAIGSTVNLMSGLRLDKVQREALEFA
jgi:membrane-associated phospholipid phosphatase